MTAFAAIMLVALLPFAAQAQTGDANAKSLLKSLGDTAGYVTTGNESNLSSLLGAVVKVALSLLGMIFVVLMIYAGYHWMTAAGDQAKVDKSKDTLWRAIIGLIIVVGAYAIWEFVSRIL